MPPANLDPLAAGEQRVMMHTGAEDGQAAFAAQRVIDAQFDQSLGGEVAIASRASDSKRSSIDQAALPKKRWYRL